MDEGNQGSGLAGGRGSVTYFVCAGRLRRGVRTPLANEPGSRPGGRPRMFRSLWRLKAAAHVQAISVILGTSVETARQYVKRARHAYDVVSRTRLVVFGLRDDRVDFDDALPPLNKPLGGIMSE